MSKDKRIILRNEIGKILNTKVCLGTLLHKKQLERLAKRTNV